MCVVKILHSGMGACIFDHTFADVDSSHLNVGVRIGYVKYPAAGATADIQYIMDIGEVVSTLRK